MLDLWVYDVRIPWDVFSCCCISTVRRKTFALGGATSSSSGGSSKAKTKRKSEDETIFSTTSLLGRGQLTGGYEDNVQLLCYKLMFFFVSRIPDFYLLATVQAII